MTALYLLEPAEPGPAWAPFTGVRPIAELRAGLWRIRERWEQALGLRCAGILGRHTEGFAEGDEPPSTAPQAVPGPAVVAASWFAPAVAALGPVGDVRRLTHDGATVAWVVPSGSRLELPVGDEDTQAAMKDDAGPAKEIGGLRLTGTASLLDALERLLEADCAGLAAAGGDRLPEQSIVFGNPAQAVSRGATVEPGVVFDVRHGPVVLDAGAEVRHGTRLEGPLYVGRSTRVLGGHVRGSVFGPECRVHGEVAVSVFLGYANKAHEGFVGHSVIGQWVNLGAGTTTSNLKNTYGPVRLSVGDTRIETGRLNVGSLIGDHAKTAIGTMLPTGTVISAGANVFGGPAPKYVPPFAWGLAGERMTEDGFLTIAERVMGRRNVALTPPRRASLCATYRRGLR